MPSVTVVWKGSCSEPRIRYRLLGHLNRLASRSGEYLDEAQPKRPALRAANKQRAETLRLRPNIETFDREISGSILISSSISQNSETIVARAREAGASLIADPAAQGTTFGQNRQSPSAWARLQAVRPARALSRRRPHELRVPRMRQP